VGVKGTEFVAINTDAQHFKIIDDRIKKILIGKTLTRGLGAGGDQMVGAKAAEVEVICSFPIRPYTAIMMELVVFLQRQLGSIPISPQPYLVTMQPICCLRLSIQVL